MRIKNQTLSLLLAAGKSTADYWIAGRTTDALAVIDAATRDIEVQSPGTGVLSPQAATHLGHAIGKSLDSGVSPRRNILALAARLLASENPAYRMVGPHVLTWMGRTAPRSTHEILQLADLCADSAATSALAIPLVAALSHNPSTALACLETVTDSKPRRVALIATAHALAHRNPALARRVRDLTIRQAAG